MSGHYAGVDLGGTAIKAAIARKDGTIVAQDSIATESHGGPDHVLQRVASLVNELTLRASLPLESVKALGMGVPGLADISSGTTKFLPNLPTQWRDIAAAEILKQRLGCEVRLLNDVRTATLGELHFGHGRNRPKVTLAFFSIGTGVGGGVAIDGRLRLGPLGAAGELGHQTMLPNGPRCGCGNRGCLETLASGPAIAAEGVRLMQMGLAPRLRDLVDGNAQLISTREMSLAADLDETVGEAIKNAAAWVGVAAANVVSILHPDLIVLGGGVAELGQVLLDSVREQIDKRVGMFPSHDVAVAKSKLGEQAGVLGAVALASRGLAD